VHGQRVRGNDDVHHRDEAGKFEERIVGAGVIELYPAATTQTKVELFFPLATEEKDAGGEFSVEKADEF